MIKSLNDLGPRGYNQEQQQQKKEPASRLEVQLRRQSMQVKARFHGGHLCGVREHGGGLEHEVSLTIGGGEAPTVHGR